MLSTSFALFLAVLFFLLITSLMFYHYSYDANHIDSPITSFYPLLKFTLVPSIGLIWYCISPVRQLKVYLYILFAALGDLLLLNQSFSVYIFGGFAFAFSHLTLASYFSVNWRRVPLFAFVMMTPNIVIPLFWLVPQFRRGTVQAMCFGIYTFILEIGACSSIARIEKYSVKCPSYCLCVFGYILFVISDSILLRNELTKTDYRTAQFAVMGTYIPAQVLLLIGIALDPQVGGHLKTN
jgi:uncharacterized membrane protein YhhN